MLWDSICRKEQKWTDLQGSSITSSLVSQRWVSDARAVRFDRSHIVLGRREDERALPDESMLPMCCKLMHHVRVMHVNTRSHAR